MPAEGQQGRRRAPPGRHELPREFVVEHQRKRLMDAIAQLSAEQGYDRTSVAEIVKRARVSRNTFYENFAGKEDCFLSAFDAALGEAVASVEVASEAVEGPWAQRVHAGMGALLRYVATNAAYARMCLVEAPAAGPAGAARYEEAIQAFVPMIRLGRRGAPRGGDLPATMEETLVGGVVWIIYQRIAKDETEFVEELLPELVEFVLTPYLGGPEARQAAGAGDGEQPA